jgi:hypothetical protein
VRRIAGLRLLSQRSLQLLLLVLILVLLVLALRRSLLVPRGLRPREHCRCRQTLNDGSAALGLKLQLVAARCTGRQLSLE